MATAAGIPDHSTASSARTSNIMENCWDASAWVQTDTRRESPESGSGEFSGDHAMEWVFKSPPWDWDNLMLFPGRGREVDRRLLSTDCSFPSSALQAPVSEEYGQKQSMDQGMGSSESRGTKGKENGESELGNCRKWVDHKPFGAESGQEQRTLASADQLESCSLSSGYNSCVLGSLGQGEKRDQGKTQLKYSAEDHPQSLYLGFGGLEIKKQVRRDEEMQSKEIKKEMNSTDSLISLKLGKQDFFEDHSGHAVGRAASVSTCPSPSLPAKRQRVQSQAAQIPRCQVQGCNLDLSSVKDYHRKHKVCEAHSKFPRVVVAGLEQRFCQQCSRFQVLNEFDEGKRSCRRRLAGHNERRRKQPQPETMTIAVAGNVSSFQDNGSWSYGNGSWSRLQNLDNQHRFSGNLKIPGSERQLFNSALSVSNADRLLMLLQNSKRNMISMSNNADNEGNNPFLKSKMEHALSLTSTPGADILAGMAPTQASHNFTGLVDSGCALSLLSSESWDGKSPSSVSSFNFSGRSHAPFEQLMVESTALSQPQHMLLGSTRDTQPDDILTKDLLSKQVQFPGHLGARHNLPPSIANHMEKEYPQGSCISAALGHYPMLSLVHGQEYKSSQQVGTMLNLMQGPASRWQSAQPSSESGQLQSLSPPRPF